MKLRSHNRQRVIVWLMSASGCFVAAAASAAASVPAAQERCQNLATRMLHHWPDASTRLVSAQWHVAGPEKFPANPMQPEHSIDLPAHCDVVGVAQERLGEGGQHYAIRFHVRLPEDWNGRFLFQGGGGSNGNLGDALGMYAMTAKPALAQGFAVLSQDSGHDNATNNDPARGGTLVFGFDEKARANYGHASLPIATRAAKALLRDFYGKPAQHSYFAGCSKGGEEGMALAQRYPEEFDGIIANAPAMSLPRAGLAEAWDTQAIASVVKTAGQPVVPFPTLSHAFSDGDLALVKTAVLAACDALDGIKDGVVDDFAHCTTARVQPELDARRCKADKQDGCLSQAQVDALVRIMGGAKDGSGNALYSDWPWDTGIGAPGWRIWKMGAANGMPPALNVVLGGASLSSDFTTPPTALDANPQKLLDFLLSFDFDRDAPRLYATNAEFPHSAWEDISARSTDLAAFRKRQGRMIVVHGVSDPVFSINDTLAWFREVDANNQGTAASFVRVFPVPGMNHCGGGDATDQFDQLAPLIAWVEQGKAPDHISATTSPANVEHARSRPLCPYPSRPVYNGTGDVAKEESFQCR